MKNNSSIKSGLSLASIVAVAAFVIACSEKRTENDGWGSCKADPKSISYSSLDQINLSNVSQLENAWTFQMSYLANIKFEDPPWLLFERKIINHFPFSLDPIH